MNWKRRGICDNGSQWGIDGLRRQAELFRRCRGTSLGKAEAVFQPQWVSRRAGLFKSRRRLIPSVPFSHPGGQFAKPIAWYGPIVMNTQAEQRQAFEELQRGEFLQSAGAKEINTKRPWAQMLPVLTACPVLPLVLTLKGGLSWHGNMG